MCTPVYGRKFVKASQFTMCRRFFLFVSFYNAADPWLLSLCATRSRSFSIYAVRVCCTIHRLVVAVMCFLSVPTGMVKHFQAHSFMDLLSMLYIFIFVSFLLFLIFGVFHICVVPDAREAIRRESEYTMFVLAFTIHMHWLGGSSTSTTFYQHTNCPN